MTALGALILGFFSNLILEMCTSFSYSLQNKLKNQLDTYNLKIRHYYCYLRNGDHIVVTIIYYINHRYYFE